MHLGLESVQCYTAAFWPHLYDFMILTQVGQGLTLRQSATLSVEVIPTGIASTESTTDGQMLDL